MDAKQVPALNKEKRSATSVTCSMRRASDRRSASIRREPCGPMRTPITRYVRPAVMGKRSTMELAIAMKSRRAPASTKYR